MTSEVLGKWVVEALNHFKGKATLVKICKYVWDNHENELRASGDLFYTWQYRIRWEGTKLRKAGLLKNSRDSIKGVWELV